MVSVKRVFKGVYNCISVVIKTVLSYVGVFSGVIVGVLGILAAVEQCQTLMQ